MGFGFLFMGLGFLKDAFEPLKNSEHVKNMFVTLSDNPLLGVLVGIAFTVLLQSSSATIAIVQVLAFNGLITFPAAIPIILGDNIGTTITAQLAALGTNVNARRTAMSHTLFNVIGVAYMMVFVYTGWFVKAINYAIPGQVTAKNVMFYIAVSHSAFNIINALIFLPFIGFLEKASIWLVPKRKGTVEMGTQYLEKHLLNTPPIALEQAKKEAVWMLDLAMRSVGGAMKSFFEGDMKPAKAIPNLEQAVDNLQSEITQYLVELSQRELLPEESQEIPVIIHSVNDIERIGDHSENIMELSERKLENKLPFTEDAIEELKRMWDEVKSMAEEVKEALEKGDQELAEQLLAREVRINEFQIELKKGHVERLNRAECDLKSGIVFMDMVDNLEKIGDHLTNIAQGIVGELRWREIMEAVSV